MRGSRLWVLATCLMLAGCIDAVHERPLHHAVPAAEPGARPAPPPRTPQAAPIVTLHPDGLEGDHQAYRFTMPSSGDNGQPAGAMSGWYFTRGHVGTPLVLIVPIYGSSAYPSWTTARYFITTPATRDMSVVLVEAEADLMDWDRLQRAATEEAVLDVVGASTVRYQTVIEDLSRLIDWAVTRPETDRDRMGIVGFSLSASIAAVVMTRDPRLSAGAFLMGGANLHEVLATCDERQVSRVRAAVMARLGWSGDTFKLKIQPKADPVNPALMPGLNGDRRTLYVEATDDDCIPKSARDALRNTLNPSEEIRLGYRHWPAFLIGMTPIGFHYLERAVVNFFAEAFRPPADASPRGSLRP